MVSCLVDLLLQASTVSVCQLAVVVQEAVIVEALLKSWPDGQLHAKAELQGLSQDMAAGVPERLQHSTLSDTGILKENEALPHNRRELALEMCCVRERQQIKKNSRRLSRIEPGLLVARQRRLPFLPDACPN